MRKKVYRICTIEITQMLIYNPNRKPSHPKEDWVIENFMHRVIRSIGAYGMKKDSSEYNEIKEFFYTYHDPFNYPIPTLLLNQKPQENESITK